MKWRLYKVIWKSLCCLFFSSVTKARQSLSWLKATFTNAQRCVSPKQKINKLPNFGQVSRNFESKIEREYFESTFNSAMFCRINILMNHDTFLLRSLEFAVKPKWKCWTFMNIGCLKNIDGKGRKYVTLKTNLRFPKLFCLYSKLLKTANVGKFQWSWILGDRTHVWTEKEKLIIVRLILFLHPPNNVA